VAAVLIPTEPIDRSWGHDRPRPALRLVGGGPGRSETPPRPGPAPTTSRQPAASGQPVVVRTRRRESPAVYRRRRTVAAGLFVGIGIAVWLAVHAVAGPAAPSMGAGQDVAVHYYTVQPGDTLWSIAARQEPNRDIRPLVDELNAEVHGQPIQAGQELQIP
jgi:LysM domain